ncbi:MAG: hypothetical protein IJX63_11520 [Lachnospiraceae bacterium]|nr:hypothetical protein [Lachnospiraceae bacterium]
MNPNNSWKEQLIRNWKRRLVCSGMAGAIIGICLVFGFCIENWKAVPYTDIRLYLVLLLICVGVTALVYVLFVFLENRRKHSVAERQYTLRQKLISWGLYSGIIMVGWMPSFLGVYPGWFNYDAPWQLSMYGNDAITAHHPVLHTVIMGWILEFMNGINGTYNKGIALYLLLQMGILALCFGYAVYYMGKKGIGRIGRGIALTWFALFPTIVLHVMCPTKDSLFAGFLLVLIILTYELIGQPEVFLKKKLKLVSWVVLVFLCIVFRQNSLYVFCLMAVPFLVILRKAWKKVAGMLVAVVALYLLYVGPFYALFEVQPGSKAEFLSVPSQQLVKVYLEQQDSLKEEELLLLEAFFEEEAFVKYRPKIADYTKGNLDMQRLEEKGGDFWKLYGTLFLQYPAEYVDAFLINTYGFWYPDATVDIYEDGVSYYFASEHVPPAVQNSKIPILLKYYKSFYTGFPVQDAGVLTWGLSMALYFYGLLITFVYMIYRKQVAGIVSCFTVLLIWMTYLLGPAALVRYVLFLFVIPPIEYVLLMKE